MDILSNRALQTGKQVLKKSICVMLIWYSGGSVAPARKLTPSVRHTQTVCWAFICLDSHHFPASPGMKGKPKLYFFHYNANNGIEVYIYFVTDVSCKSGCATILSNFWASFKTCCWRSIGMQHTTCLMVSMLMEHQWGLGFQLDSS